MYFSAILHEVQQKSQDSTSTFRWYCHFDDDVYVNVPVLMRTLREHKDKQYLGHWHRNKRYPFHYASGAGYCISSSLMSQLEPFVRSDPTTCTHFKVSKRLVINLLKVIVLLHSGSSTFASTCDTLQCVDDVTVGAVIGMFNFTASFTSGLWMAFVCLF